MKRWTTLPGWLAILIMGAACAHGGPRAAGETAPAGALWREAHMALYMEDFARSDSLFERLAASYPGTDEGREAVFYLGTVQLHPRNPQWNTESAETSLRRYLLQDTTGVLIHRRPEAQTLLELARQFNIAPAERDLTPVQDTSPNEPPAPRLVGPAQVRQLNEEIERLRRELNQRDQQIQRQREELERVRRTLTPRTP